MPVSPTDEQIDVLVKAVIKLQEPVVPTEKIAALVAQCGFECDTVDFTNKVYETKKRAWSLLKAQVDHSSYDQAKQMLSEKYTSAYRLGIGNQRLGLFKSAVSDHIPVSFNFQGERCLTWNMLADKYLECSFLNLSGLQLLQANISDRNSLKNKCHVFMQNFVGFIYSKYVDANVLEINAGHFAEFMAKVKLSLQSDYQEVVDILCNENDINHEEYQNCLRHALQLQKLINSGEISWLSRLRLLSGDKDFVGELQQHGFMSLQECTNPRDVLELIQTMDERFDVIIHTVEDDTNDHCALIYDKNKYELQDTVKFGLGGGWKPAILARFKNRETGECCVIGSIHHPGRKSLETPLILEQLKKLIGSSVDIPYLVAGDFNRAPEEIVSSDTVYFVADILDKKLGTMAGPDYGNTNVCIDNAISNQAGVIGERIHLPIARPIDLDLEIKFSFDSVDRSITLHS